MTAPAAARVMRLVPPDPGALPAHELEACLGALSSAARRVRRGQDREAIHDLRVASRRLTATLELWQPLLDARGARRARRRVRRLRRALRPARDGQVARAALLERVAGVEPGTRAVLEALVARLDRQLRRDTAASRSIAGRRRIRRIRRTVARAIANGVATPVDATALAATARAHVGKRREVSQASIVTAARERTPERWHQARLDIKRWRYAAECARLVLGDGAAEVTAVAILRSAQDALGFVQDLEVQRTLVLRRAARAAAGGRTETTRLLTSLAGAIEREQHAAMDECYRLATTLSAGTTGF